MTDSEGVDSSVRRVRASLRVLLDDQGTLVVANTLNVAADALIRIRRYLVRADSEPGELLPIIEFIDELTAMLLPIAARAGTWAGDVGGYLIRFSRETRRRAATST